MSSYLMQILEFGLTASATEILISIEAKIALK